LSLDARSITGYFQVPPKNYDAFNTAVTKNAYSFTY